MISIILAIRMTTLFRFAFNAGSTEVISGTNVTAVEYYSSYILILYVPVRNSMNLFILQARNHME